MEDAVDALKMAAAVFVFVLALSIVFMVFSQAREVSDIVLGYSDKTNFIEYNEPDINAGAGRTVGIETVIPTLYRYYKEKYSVDIVLASGNVQEKFDEEVERKIYNRVDTSQKALYKDGCPWLARPNEDIKNRVTAYISKKDDKVNNITLSKYRNSSLKDLRNSNFIETFRQVDTTPTDSIIVGDDGSTIYLQRGTKKTYITYTVK